MLNREIDVCEELSKVNILETQIWEQQIRGNQNRLAAIYNSDSD